VIDFLGRADLLDPSLVHHDYTVGELERLFLVVGDEDAGYLDLVVEPPEPSAQFLPHLGIERAERLVEQQDFGFDGERARESDALALAAGELRRVAIGKKVELHEFQQFMHAPRDHGLVGALAPRNHAHPESDVFEHRHVAEQRVVLKYETDLALANLDGAGVLAMEQHLARVGRLEPSDYPEQRGLARTRQPEQRDQLAGFDMQVDIVNRNELAELLGYVSELDTHAATLIARSSCSAFAGTTRRSRKRLAMSVAMASRVSSDETANAAANW